MARLYHDFLCTNEVEPHIFEKFTDKEKNPNPVCPHCGELSNWVLVSAPTINLDGCSGDFPGAADRWIKVRAEKMAQERKKNS